MEVLSFLVVLLTLINRNSRSKILFKTDVFENFANFTGKHLWWTLSLIKLQAFRPSLKRDINTDVFP